MEIRVISLSTSTERRRSITQQFGRLNTGFEFFDAVTPRKALECVNGYHEAEFMLNCGRPATSSEIACYASHLSLWRQCADDGEPYLILEDDARLDGRFPDAMRLAERQIGLLGFLRVSMPELSTSVVMRGVDGFQIHFCRRVPLLALGYAIAPETATQLVRHGSTVEEPVDKYLQRYWRHEQPVYAVVPPVVHLTEHAELSDIGPRFKRPQSGLLRLRRAARKAGNSVARTLFAASFLLRPRPSEAPDDTQ